MGRNEALVGRPPNNRWSGRMREMTCAASTEDQHVLTALNDYGSRPLSFTVRGHLF
jgi:hypothetical protein